MEITKKITSQKHCDILGIGSPLLDIVINIEETMFCELNMKKGSMNLISAKESRDMLKKFGHIKQKITPGGSVANTLSGASALGNKTSFLGVIGKDIYGQTYQTEIKNEGIVSHLTCHTSDTTGHAIIFVTPDGERTMATHLGAALRFEKEHIKEDQIKNSQILHIEAYQLENSDTCQAILHAIKIAKDNNVTISLDLSDVGLIQRNRKLFKSIVKEHIDVVFANEAEAVAFTGKNDSITALHEIAKACDIAVVKLGAKGSLIKKGEKIFNIQPYPVDMVNTNGAGDTYAAGILHGLINGLDLQDAGEIASHISALVVASVGARLDKKYIKSISKYKRHGKETRL
ncbi:MAG: adenosine kinase [Candidatus Moranbacteria bacterium]|nr:adenosine kinase [Candidatus Moranbacteria bacterium]